MTHLMNIHSIVNIMINFDKKNLCARVCCLSRFMRRYDGKVDKIKENDRNGKKKRE